MYLRFLLATLFAVVFNVASLSAVEVYSTAPQLSNGKVVFSLWYDKEHKKPVTFKSLKTVHTKKMHVMVIDDSLKHFSHIHPTESKKVTGSYEFSWKPSCGNTFKMWVDITPTSSAEPVYVPIILQEGKGAKSIVKDVELERKIDNFDFKLEFDDKPKVGAPLMGKITVTENGKQFNKLEPVLGAFVHIAAFGEDFNSFFHTHPMGKEPKSLKDRGAGAIAFHVEGLKKGYVKLFAQFKIDGKDVIVPFGFVVE